VSRRGEAGRASAIEAQRARKAARIEDFEFLLDNGEEPVKAAKRAGWPSLAAAERALRRDGHPVAHKLEAIRKRHGKAWWEAA
jgi:hypothetical protein